MTDLVAAGCPHLAGYNPLSPEELRDPYPSFQRARREAPVFYSEAFGMWEVSRKADVLAVLRDNENFNVSQALPWSDPPASLRDRLPEYPWTRSVLLLDDPQHKVARAVIQAPFTPRSLKERTPRIRELSERLLQPLADDGRLEFVEGYSLPLSLAVIGDIMGVPEQDFGLLRDAVSNGFRLLSGTLTTPEDILAASEPLADLHEYMTELIEARRSDPQDDYTSVMVTLPKPDGTQETTAEMIKHLYSILGAGFETSASMMAHGMSAILDRPEQWQQLQDDRTLIDGAVEEMLRYRTLVKRIFRVASFDVEVGGVKIPKDSLVSLQLASADRDEEAYEAPDTFDIHRKGDHLAFGKWKHFCLGAPLARLEMKVTLETFLDRYPGVRLVAGQELTWRPDLRLDALTGLELELPAAA